MRLSREVIEIIGKPREQQAKAIRTMLALDLHFTERWVLKCIEENKDNGPLTTVKAVERLKKETGLRQSQILIEEQEIEEEKKIENALQ